MKNKTYYFFYAFTLLLLIVLPYYLFDNRLFIGGDDTRLFYVYPQEFLKAMAFFSWANVSSLGLYNPSFHFVPFLLLWSAVSHIVNSKITLDYLAFSLPLILGFIYFQKLLKSLFLDI